MDDDVELDVLLVTLFGLIALMFSEINTCVALLSYGYLHLRGQSRHRYTISKHFNGVLNTLLKLYNVLLVNPEPVPEDSNDYRWKYFKGCLGALDGTYIPVRVPHSEIPRYRNRKWIVSVNVLAVCYHHMNFVFVLSGWEGSAADSRILRDALSRPNGLRVPNGCYYLCDGGYTNCNGFLAPYRDPLEDEIDDVVDDGNDGVDAGDGFIDQVESSQEWTTMRDNLAIQIQRPVVKGRNRNSGRWSRVNGQWSKSENAWSVVSGCRGGRGRKRVGSTTRCVWTFAEECELMNALNDLVSNGHKCDNGFRSGYLSILENNLGIKFPGTDLKGEPHINSKIHVWKRQYVCLKGILGITGVGLNSTTYHVEALPEVWEARIKVDPFTKSLKNKAFPFYHQWEDIFGNDRANGRDSQLYADVVNEATHGGRNTSRSQMDIDEDVEENDTTDNCTTDKTSFSADETSAAPVYNRKGIKRKQTEGVDPQFMHTVGNYLNGSKDMFGQIAETMGHIAKHVGSEFDNRQRMEQVYDRLSEIDIISVEARVAIAQYLCNNMKDMDLFFSLPDEAKIVFVMNIMRNLANL
ncbi:hypothetical protein ACS0TY_020338 [Phlomoides rotata]